MADTPEAIAYQEALRSIAQQQSVLEGLYARAGILLSAAAVAAAFLGGQAFEQGAWGCWGFVAMASFVGIGGLTVAILWPRGGWVFRLKADKLVSDYVDEPLGNVAAMQRDLALHMENHYRSNKSKLEALLWLFRIEAALLIVEVLLWLAELGGGSS